jgi:hypothetical protein
LALLFCTQATADDGQKVNLLGLHDTILAFQWPTQHTLVVYMKIENAPDGGHCRFTATGRHSGKLVGDWWQTLRADPGRATELITYDPISVVFPEPDDYAFVVEVDGIPIGESIFLVRSATPPG